MGRQGPDGQGRLVACPASNGGTGTGGSSLGIGRRSWSRTDLAGRWMGVRQTVGWGPFRHSVGRREKGEVLASASAPLSITASPPLARLSTGSHHFSMYRSLLKTQAYEASDLKAVCKDKCRRVGYSTTRLMPARATVSARAERAFVQPADTDPAL